MGPFLLPNLFACGVTMMHYRKIPYLRIFSDCCGAAAENASLKQQNRKLKRRNEFLTKRNIRLERAHDRLQQCLTSKLLPSTNKPFEDIEGVEGCPPADRIFKMSMLARDSDYIFIKLLMNAIWPDGFAGRSVTGRYSNNPKGRRKKSVPEGQTANQTEPTEDGLEDGLEDGPEDGSEDGQDKMARPEREGLEPDKVKFVHGNV